MTTKTKTEKEQAIEYLRTILKPGYTVYTSLNHVSKSGMMRIINLHVIKENQPWRITSSAVAAGLGKYNFKHEGLRMDGCGMDMGFAAVYELSHILFPDGFIPADANMHGRNGTPATDLDTDGGYALRQQWL